MPMTVDAAFSLAGAPINPANNAPVDRRVKVLAKTVSLLRKSEADWIQWVEALREAAQVREDRQRSSVAFLTRLLSQLVERVRFIATDVEEQNLRAAIQVLDEIMQRAWSQFLGARTQ